MNGRKSMKKLTTVLAGLMFAMVATLGLAQTMTPPASEPIKRTPLQKTEYPDGHFTYIMMVEIRPNATAARHTHPGLETSYILEGELELRIDGQPPQKLKGGDSFTVPVNAVHSGTAGDKGVKLIGVFVVDKNKPLATPAPATQ
jgi:quercetin dioxygenase-like cupin family protein